MIAVAPRRPTFNYAVIHGGAYDEHELKAAIASDPVVALHYRDVDAATMRPAILESDLMAYVSYRLSDRVYWTKHRVRIRRGETILTNGQTEIRGRCGNCISMAPLLPTSDEEPDLLRLDSLSDNGPLLVSWSLNPFGGPIIDGGGSAEPLTFGPLAPGLLGSVPIGGVPIGGVPIGGVPIGGVPIGGVPIGGAPIAVAPIDATPISPGEQPTGGIPSDTPPLFPTPGLIPDSPSAGSPLSGGLPPGGGFPIGGPSELGPLVLAPLLGGDSGPPTLPPTVPSDVNPVPEPGTFLLLGCGIAGLLARHRRSKTI